MNLRRKIYFNIYLFFCRVDRKTFPNSFLINRVNMTISKSIDYFFGILGLPNNALELVSGLANMSSRSSEESISKDGSESDSIEVDSGSEMSNTTSSQLSTSYSG